jgi:copper chaperone
MQAPSSRLLPVLLIVGVILVAALLAAYWTGLVRQPGPSAASTPPPQTMPAATRVFAVKGMHCDGCAARIAGDLQKLPGILSARVSFDQAKAWVNVGPNPPADAAIEKAVADAGYQASRIPE